MDRRQKKTRSAIYAALSKLLDKKRFSEITVQEILNEADVGRSTFYTHFETRDDLLREMCTEIFTHIFSAIQTREKGHDFSGEKDSLDSQLVHILYHLRDNDYNLAKILCSESAGMFMQYFREYLVTLFENHADEIKNDAPLDFKINFLVGSFADTISWWVKNDMKDSPETVISYYLKCIM